AFGLLGREPVRDRVLRGALRELGADVVPEAQVGDERVGRVVVDRRAWHLDYARLDRVHEREVADRPREDVPLVVAGTLEVERRRREVPDLLDARVLGDRL